jgi:hypothetical protein
MAEKDPISNVVWGLWIGANFMVDGIEAVLDYFFMIGFFVNPPINIFMAMVKAFFILIFKVRLSPLQIFSTIGFSAGEMIGDGAVPLLGVSAVLLMVNHKAAFALDNVPVVGNLK